MSEIAEAARAFVVIADYAAPDPAGRMNLVGAGWQVTAINPQTGHTPSHAVAAIIEVPPRFIGDTYSLELSLLDDAGQLVNVPGPLGDSTPLRVGQVVQVEAPQVPGMPRDAVWSRSQMVLNFQPGLPLKGGHTYTWRLRIDGDDSHLCEAAFYVHGGQPGPVVG